MPTSGVCFDIWHSQARPHCVILQLRVVEEISYVVPRQDVGLVSYQLLWL